MRSKSLVATLVAFLLGGCIAGGGEPYDDSQSVYEPTIQVGQTIVDDANYQLIADNVVTKFHEDVGQITEITFQYTNHTSELVYLTTNVVKFDQVDVDISVMAFFESMEPQQSGTLVAYFQDIREQDFFFTPPTKSIYMELEIVKEDGSDIIALYPMEITF